VLFLSGNKDSNPCLEDPDFISPAKNGQRVGSLNPNSWIRNNTNVVCSSRNTNFRLQPRSVDAKAEAGIRPDCISSLSGHGAFPLSFINVTGCSSGGIIPSLVFRPVAAANRKITGMPPTADCRWAIQFPVQFSRKRALRNNGFLR
jgi:hypothetical protein